MRAMIIVRIGAIAFAIFLVVAQIFRIDKDQPGR